MGQSFLHRLALFTGNYGYVIDGVAITLHRLVRYLEAQGIQVMVFSPTIAHPPLKGPGTVVSVPSLPIPGRSEYRMTLWPQAAVWHRLHDFAPHLLHIATPDLLGLRALRRSQQTSVPVLATYHTHFVKYLKYYHLGILETPLMRYLVWFYQQCDRVCVPTRPIRDALTEAGVDARRLRIWGRGVDTERFHPRHRSRRWRRQLEVADDEVLVAFVGRLVREKGLWTFADVIKRLKQRGFPVRGLIVGEGPLRQPLEEALPTAIFTGRLDGAALAQAYASADVFLYPSDSEAFGNVVVEAMASGLPVVATDTGGSSAHIDPGRTGLLAPPQDTAAFLRATTRLVEQAALRRRLGQAARTRAERHYHWDHTLARMVGHYRAVIHEPAHVGLEVARGVGRAP